MSKFVQKNSAAILLVIAIGVAGCLSNPFTSSATQILVIGPERVTCQGFIEQECLMEKNEDTDLWEFFYEEIEGFTHVPGFIYTLEVKVTDRGTEIQDVGRYAYTLVRVIGRERVTSDFSYNS